ncbi:hypothetical protein [Actinokineospora cianjurensis]|uniref:YcaO domain-containing protein n=1 Tax=Actinokineospora cianjurensis TaxID=585224 RepID=A0A421B5C6_9PSEU|nr:hypothetical protein [Actinokineospora cianjurensis]RLK59470.1 hypothetical protein CLV68_3959 [Actinokineospora cianjurensis]
MVLVLRPDAYVAETPNGAFVLTNSGSYTFTGHTIFALLTTIKPYINGEYTLDQLAARINKRAREVAVKLLTGMLDLDIVRDIERLKIQSSQPEVRFIEYFQDDAARTYSEYCSMSALIIGRSPLAQAVEAACRLSGLRTRSVDQTEDREAAPMDSAAMDDVIFVVGGEPDYHSKVEEELSCDHDGVLVHATTIGEAWFCCIGKADEAVWASVTQRLAARRAPAQAPRASPEGRPDDHAVRVLAAQLVHNAFRLITTPSAARGGVNRVDQATLASEPISYLRHPYTLPAQPRTATQFAHRIATLAASPELDEEAFSRHAVSCTGEWTGVFGLPTEREFAQTPLCVCQIEVSATTGGSTSHVTGAGLDFAAARYQASLRAFASYGSTIFDPRQMLDINEQPLVQRAEGLDLITEDLQSGRLAGFVWAYNLATSRPMLLDAVRAFPNTDEGSHLGSAAAAYSWKAAISAALISQCHRMTLLEQTGSAPELDITNIPPNSQLEHYRVILSKIGPVVVRDITGSLEVPTVICLLKGVHLGSGSGLSYLDAVTAAMEEALLSYQASANQQPEYAPPTAPTAPQASRSRLPFPVDRPRTVDSVIQTLHRSGHTPLVVPLDHDPEVAAIMPYLVRVVLSDGR